jgi:hypothetical protein
LAEAATRGSKFDILAKPTHPTAMLDTALDLLVANQSKQPLAAATSARLSFNSFGSSIKEIICNLRC